MKAPTSYAGPRRDDGKTKRTFSQTTESNLWTKTQTVENVLAQKGRDVFSIHPDDTMLEAVDILREKRIGALIVTSLNGELEGILSERDIVRKLSETPGEVMKQKVSVLMTRKIQVCSPDEPLVSVLRRMTEGRFRHMPVVADDKLIGMVTIGDVVNFRLKTLEEEAIKLKQMIVG